MPHLVYFAKIYLSKTVLVFWETCGRPARGVRAVADYVFNRTR